MKIGLFGGSFNPPHQGHLHISNLAIKKLKLDQVWWIPTSHNPFKNKAIYESYDKRCKKCSLLIEKNPKIILKEIDEIYTEKLVKNLQNKYKNYHFIWIMGADNLEKFHQWDYFKNLIKLIPFAIFSREKHLLKIRKTKSFTIYKSLKKNKNSLPQFLIFRTKNLNISSTEIRQNIQNRN